MFSLKIIDTDMFLDMPSSARLLYYDLSMRADDDGFVSSPKKIQKITGCSDDDFKILIAKKFIIPFESGICVITHWRIHNYIQKDRYNETLYLDEKATLIEDNGTFEKVDTKCIQPVHNLDTQVRLGKDRLEVGKDNLNVDVDEEKLKSFEDKIQIIIKKWNNLKKLTNIKNINKNTVRYRLLIARLKEYSLEDFFQAIDNIEKSSFLNGQNKNGWNITFDWFIKPNNFLKVLEGNYNGGDNNTNSGEDNKKHDFGF